MNAINMKDLKDIPRHFDEKSFDEDEDSFTLAGGLNQLAMDHDDLLAPRPRPLPGKNPLLHLVNKYIDKLQHIHT